MRKYKKQLAAALAVTMVLNQGLSAAAARRNAGEFVRTEDGWQYVVGGEYVCDQLVESNGKTYYLDGSGILVKGEMFNYGDVDDFSEMYAMPDGVVAIDKWVNMSAALEEPEWHYFNKKGVHVTADPDGELNFRDTLTKDEKQGYYAFNQEGMMLSRTWYNAPLSEKAENPVPQLYYAQYSGEGAKDKWLFIGGEDGKWYEFDSKGIKKPETVEPEEPEATPSEPGKPGDGGNTGGGEDTDDKDPASPSNPGGDSGNTGGGNTGGGEDTDDKDPASPPVASPTNIKASVLRTLNKTLSKSAQKASAKALRGMEKQAPCQTVDAITPVKTDVTAEKGKEVSLKFNVKLNENEKADVTGKLTENHDFYYELHSTDYTAADNFTVKAIADTNGTTYTINYTPSSVGTMELYAVIDDVKSEKVTVNVPIPTSEEEKKEAEDTVNNTTQVIKDILNTENVTEGVSSLRNAFMIMDIGKNKPEDNKTILEAWRKNFANLMELEMRYMMQDGNIDTSNELDAKAASLLGIGKGDLSKAVKVAGLALNCKSGESATFKMNYVPGQDKPVITEKHPGKKQVTFDMGLLIDGNEKQPNVPLVIEMPVPSGFKGSDIVIYHFHEDEEPYAIPVEYIPSTKTIRFAVDRFSEFTFVGAEADTTNNNNNGSSSNRYYGSHRSSRTTTVNVQNGQNGKPAPTPGQWNQLADGKWQFVNNGTPYTNTWIYVNERWYWIDAAGMMAEGWQNVNGKMYFMVYGSGYMWTGWMTDSIDWFYFDETGALVTNGTTADGYQVDARGAWIH